MKKTLFMILFATLAVYGCSSDEEGGTAGSGGSAGSGGTAGSGGSAGSGGTAGSGGSAGEGGMGGSAGMGGTPGAIYEQDFESLDDMSATALTDDGWQFFANVYDGSDVFKFPYGPFGAPNATVSPTDTFISAVVSGEGDVPQGTQQLSVFNDYNCCGPGVTDEGHFNGTDKVEINVFQERTIVADDIGKTLTFSFDAKRGNIEGATTALAFIKTLDPNANFATTNNIPEPMTGIPATWGGFMVSLDLTDPLLEGQILQIGFVSTASDFEGSGIFYDNLVAVIQ